MPETEPNPTLLDRLRRGLNGPDVTPEGIALIVAEWLNTDELCVSASLADRIYGEVLCSGTASACARHTAASLSAQADAVGRQAV